MMAPVDLVSWVAASSGGFVRNKGADKAANDHTGDQYRSRSHPAGGRAMLRENTRRLQHVYGITAVYGLGCQIKCFYQTITFPYDMPLCINPAYSSPPADGYCVDVAPPHSS